MYPKVTLEFESNTLALNEYVDGPYHIRTTATVSGTLEMINIRSVNPANANQQALKIQARAAANQLFAQLKVEKVSGSLTDNPELTLGLNNHLYQISLEHMVTPSGDVTLSGELIKQIQNILKNGWQISGEIAFRVNMTATRRHNSNSKLAVDIDDVEDYVTKHWLTIGSFLSRQVFRLFTASEDVMEAGGAFIGSNPEVLLVFVS